LDFTESLGSCKRNDGKQMSNGKKPCVFCAELFTYTSHQQKYCSLKCRYTYHDQRKKSRKSNTAIGIARPKMPITLPYIPERLIEREENH